MGGIVSTPPTHKFPLPTTMETSEYVRPSKLLLNVTIDNSLGAIQVFMSHEDTVVDLIKATLVIYNKEKRRPLLKDTDPKCYDLHYSPYTLQSNLSCFHLLLLWLSLLFYYFYILYIGWFKKYYTAKLKEIPCSIHKHSAFFMLIFSYSYTFLKFFRCS